MSNVFLRHPEESDLALFAGGELGPLARWRIEGHLGRCDECRRQVSEFFELRSRVMDLAELPQMDWAAMAARIERRAELERTRPRPMASWRPAWSAAVALLLLVGAGVYVTRQRLTPDSAVLGASAGGVELRLGRDQVFTLTNTARKETQVNWRVSGAEASARYVDPDTGNITVTNVYSE